MTYVLSKNALKQSTTTQIVQLAASQEQFMASWMKDRPMDVGNWRRPKLYPTALKDSFVGKAARKSASASLQQVMEAYGYYENIIIADTAGELMAAAKPDVIGKINVKARDGYRSGGRREPAADTIDSQLINNFAKQLDAGADPVGSGAARGAASSRLRAKGSSEQAAALEETSSSREEPTSMTKQNADHARDADGLMKDARQIFAKANDNMNQMTVSMRAITKTGKEAQKIVKTIASPPTGGLRASACPVLRTRSRSKRSEIG